MQVDKFLDFAKAIRLKYCYLQKKDKLEGKNMYLEPNSCNVYGLLDICIHEICRLGSELDREGEDCS